jgi:hypothetical protein
MTDGNHTGKVRRVGLCKNSNMTGGVSPIMVGARPTAARVTDSRILDIRGGDAFIDVNAG